MKENGIDLKDFAEKIVENNFAVADSVVIAAVKDGRIAIGLAGVDDSGMSPENIALASAMNDVLEEHLSVANVISKALRKSGIMSVQKHSEKIIRNREELENDDKDSENGSDADEIREAVERVIEIVTGLAKGGEKHADDD